MKNLALKIWQKQTSRPLIPNILSNNVKVQNEKYMEKQFMRKKKQCDSCEKNICRYARDGKDGRGARNGRVARNGGGARNVRGARNDRFLPIL